MAFGRSSLRAQPLQGKLKFPKRRLYQGRVLVFQRSAITCSSTLSSSSWHQRQPSSVSAAASQPKPSGW